jgi:hypothetical protein
VKNVFVGVEARFFPSASYDFIAEIPDEVNLTRKPLKRVTLITIFEPVAIGQDHTFLWCLRDL